MTFDEALRKHLSGLASLPWETSAEQATVHFTAGWHSHVEALKQGDLWTGTLTSDLRPISSTGKQRRPCSAEVSVQVGDGAVTQHCDLANAPHDHDFLEITAEKIYEAWPVKKARGAAIAAIKKAMKKEKPEALLSAVKELAACYAAWPAEDRPFFVMCSTFMNQERWLDDRSTWRRGKQSTATRRDAF